MASKPVQSSKVSILTPDYMELLQGLCLINKPSVKDVVAIFKEFRRSLDIRKPESSSTRSKSSPTSSSTPKKRGRKSAGRASAVGDKAGGDGCAIVPGDVGFERSCTWEPGQKPCWITSVLDLWNRVLTRNCVELRQHTWDELTLQGYQWPENRPKLADMLPVSLLIHVLLRQHRCVTSIFLNMSMTFIERHVIWHALKTGAVGVKRLYYGQSFIDQRGLMQSVEKVTCSEAIASMTNLSRLSLSGIWFSREVVQIIGTYVEHATALSVLELRAIEAGEEDAGRFLDHLARNRSVKNLSVCETFLFARNGKALADVVQDHMCLEEIDVTGCPDRSPSPLLRAAVRSKTLRSLAVHQCRIEAQDIEVMAYALTRSPLATEIDAGTTPPPPVSPLRKLVFENCVECSLRLEAAYAKLIGGVLTHLTLSNCGLGSLFAMGAAFQLYFDESLLELNVEHHYFAIGSLRSLIEALEFNKPLQSLVVNMGAQHTHRELSSLFTMIQKVGAFSRLKLQWVCPRASDFSYSTLAVHTPSAYVNLDWCTVEEAVECLGTIASNRNIDVAVIEFARPAEPVVVQKLVDALTSTKSLKNLILNATLADADVVKLFRALECNRTIYMLALHRIIFTKRNAQALARLIENSRTLAFLRVDLRRNDTDVDRPVGSRHLCQELKRAVRQNHFITDLSVNMGTCDISSDPVIRDAMRRNSMLVVQAVRFVEGSMEKADALAFETLQHCESVRVWLHVHSNVSPESAVQMVVEARKRLAFDYFILTGVVKSKISCHRSRKAKKKTLFDDIDRDLQARICSYLSLRDVVDI